MNPKEVLQNKIDHLKEVERLLLRGREEGLIREVRRKIEGYEREYLNGVRTGKWKY